MAQPSRNWLRMVPVAALLFGVVAAVAFAVGVASGAGPSALAANPQASASSSGSIPGHPEFGFGWKTHMGGRMGGADVEITIAAIDGTNLSLKTTDGWTRTIDAAGAAVTKGGQTASLSDLKVGDTIVFREQRQSDGSYKITAIEVVLPHVAGTVSAVTASSVTVKQADGSSKTIGLTSATVYKAAGSTVDRSAVVAGADIVAEGTVDSAGTFTASTVQIEPAKVVGTVSSKTSDTIVVKTADGSTVTIDVTSSTKFMVPGQANAGLANIATGDRIAAAGTRNSDGSLTATQVMASPAGQPGFGPGMAPGMGWGFGGRMRNGMGMPWTGTPPAAPSTQPSY